MPQLLSMILAVFLLAACAAGGGMPAANGGIVTNDPAALPDISWQTPGQRDDLARQSEAFARGQTQSSAQQPPASDPSRPSLQTIVGAPPVTPVKVAILLPLTGKHAGLGQSMMKAAQMALFDVGSQSFELIPEDTASTPQGAAAAAQKAVAGKANLILGPIFAEDVKAAKPAAAAAHVPMIAYSTDWTLADNNTYVLGFLPFLQVARVTEFAKRNGYANVGIIAPQTDYADIVLATLERVGSRPVAAQRFSPAQPDLSAIVSDFVSMHKKPEGGFAFNALMLPLGGESLRTLVALLDQQGIRAGGVKLLGTGLWDDAALTNDPGLYGGWFAAPDPQSRRDFDNRYRSNYGETAPRLATLAYDSTALAAVLARTNVTGGNPYGRAQLTNSRGFAGIDGVFRFRSDGLAERALAILEIQSSRLKVVDPAPTAFGSSGS